MGPAVILDEIPHTWVLNEIGTTGSMNTGDLTPHGKKLDCKTVPSLELLDSEVNKHTSHG